MNQNNQNQGGQQNQNPNQKPASRHSTPANRSLGKADSRAIAKLHKAPGIAPGPLH
jgi:hypothetical protein